MEVTTKGETDYLITDEALVKLKILNQKELNYAKELTRKIGRILTKELAKKNLHLIDLKIELGRIDGKIQLIDDISPDVLRVCSAKIDKNGNCLAKCEGKNILDPLKLSKMLKIKVDF